MIKLVDNIFDKKVEKPKVKEYKVEKINALYSLINKFKKHNNPVIKKGLKIDIYV